MNQAHLVEWSPWSGTSSGPKIRRWSALVACRGNDSCGIGCVCVAILFDVLSLLWKAQVPYRRCNVVVPVSRIGSRRNCASLHGHRLGHCCALHCNERGLGDHPLLRSNPSSKTWHGNEGKSGVGIGEGGGCGYTSKEAHCRLFQYWWAWRWTQVMRKGPLLYLEGEDCETFKEGEEITFLR